MSRRRADGHKVKMAGGSKLASPDRPGASRARVFRNVNLTRPPSYWNYCDFSPEFNRMDDYVVNRKIGRGKYSVVFSGRSRSNDEPCVLKVLKPVKWNKIQREVKILQNVWGGPNIIKLLDVTLDPKTYTPTLVFESVDAVNYRELFPRLSEYDVRFYVFEILKALHYAHSQGIIHRDVKPHNLVFDPKKRQVRLIDWGLAEFYHPDMEYNCRVASRYFKGPELLVDFRDYDYSLDIWSLGCVVAHMVFQKEPFFKGADNIDQLFRIAKVLGTDELEAYMRKYQRHLASHFDNMRRGPRKSWRSFINKKNKHLATDEAIDFIDKCLQYDHQSRPTAAEAMQHPWFDPVRNDPDGAKMPDEFYDPAQGIDYDDDVDMADASSSSSSAAAPAAGGDAPDRSSAARKDKSQPKSSRWC